MTNVVIHQKKKVPTEVSKEIAFGKYIGAVAHIEENQGRGLIGLVNDFLNHKTQRF